MLLLKEELGRIRERYDKDAVDMWQFGSIWNTKVIMKYNGLKVVTSASFSYYLPISLYKSQAPGMTGTTETTRTTVC